MLNLSHLSTTSLPIHEVVLLLFYFVTGVYAVFSGVLYYHWKEYATDKKVTAYTLTTYFIATIPLIVVMGILTLTIN